MDIKRQLRIQEFRALLRDPNTPVATIDDAYLRLEGEQLWIEALERAKTDGRGAMMVDLRRAAQGELDVYYLPYALLLADLPPGESALTIAVKEYDLAHEAIIVIWHSQGSTFYRLGERAPMSGK
jgi:hypothetical protein